MGLPQIGEIFDNFKILDDLGSGGMGHVFLAEDISLGRKVALKFLGQGHEKLNATVVGRFEREARVLASFNHPNIVNIYSIGKYAGMSYICMEYVKGANLGDIIETGAFEISHATQVIKQVLLGLHEAHKKGILHRDIKPENILLDAEDKVKIVDFGICKDMSDQSERITKENLILGTISYMAPEVIQFESPSAASDLFSLGVVFYELVVGHHPFQGSAAASRMYRICHETIKFPRDWYDKVPVGMPEVIERMTSLNLDYRYKDAEEVIHDLENMSEVILPSFRSVELESDVVFSDTAEAQQSLLQGGYDMDEALRIIEMAQELETNSEMSEMEDHVAKIMAGTEEVKLEGDDDKTVAIEVSGPLSKKSLALAAEHFDKNRKKFIMPELAPNRANLSLSNLMDHMRVRPKLTAFGLLVLLSIAFWVNKGPSEPQASASSLNFFQRFIEDLKRTVASVPAEIPVEEEVKPLEQGNTIKIQRTRESMSGNRFFDVVDELNIVSSSGDIIYSKLKDGEDNTESVLQFARNPFLPPLRKVAKGKFNIKNVIVNSDKDIFPLEVGRRFDVFYTSDNGVRKEQFSRSCKVIAQETIQDSVVFQVDCTTRGAGVQQSSQMFYSPKHNLILREVRTVDENGTQFKEIHQVIDI